jgi:membrane-bound lytic murein transglycosylase D
MKLKPLVYFCAGTLLSAAVISSFAFRETNSDEAPVDVKDGRKLQYEWYIPDAPKAITFAGEHAPMKRWDVKEYLDREILSNSYRHAATFEILRSKTRYFPVIEARLKANGVPDDFKYLCVAESALTNATSSAGAKGFWQFMKDTGPRYGLEITNEVDERYHVTKATDAACRYLNEAYSKFGSWTAAAASYNCGQAGYNKQVVFQNRTNYYDLMLPEETMRYIFRILAFKHIMTNPQELGFNVLPQDEYLPIKTRKITVSQSIPDLAVFAQNNGSDYKMLKLLNPWLRERTLTITGAKTYEIELPAQ